MKELEEVKGVGPKTLTLLKKLNINNTNDLISFYPFRYEIIKRSDVDSLNQDDKIIIDGSVESIPYIVFFNRKMNKMSFRLNTGKFLLNVVIFNRGFLKNNLNINTTITVIGKYDKLKNTVVASDIKFGFLSDETKIEGVYHSTYGLSGSKVQKYIDEVLKDIEVINYIPESIINKYNFMDKKESVYEVHKPSNMKRLKFAQEGLKYEELFLFMLQMNFLKLGKNKQIGIKRNVDFTLVESFIKSLPFELTKDQLTAVNDIHNDMISSNKMNRLLQGDVGSGKTIVAVIGMYINYLSGYMSAMMAPTEVLAIQHYENISKIFEKYNVKIALLTGKLKKSEKDSIAESISNGSIDIIIGTHALITDNINYHKLGLVITDEQHRFGVNQRSAFKNKGDSPDILYMSATPIPRTYALTLYGDMDITSIKTMPSGRKKVTTILKSEKEIMDVLELMYEELKKNHQIYVIVPLIEESDKLDMEWIEKVETQLNKAFGKNYKIASLHGKMSSDEKAKYMDDFKNNKIQILISTTVIEVGVDVANATMMVIYDSYRFGLSTLHQLRGRVGRSSLDSYCVLISNSETKRLEILTKTNDGFIISEEDFKLRGSGDLFGIRQSGDMNFMIADIKQDYKLLLQACDDSLEFLEQNKEIDKIENPYLKELIVKTSELG
ncbi:MAG: ATP-dependent DNA helicase RecG [Bacilli bacterium]|nr:ATP-dependent DNA helicase RecG [Bacilli bacterium]MDD4282485.1 ATP-dependent DNA helicase RecG [Bacilli bacterium]MDD4718851.1 ATP-dependent DNA helicase RecG [Bacilli bacterium]